MVRILSESRSTFAARSQMPRRPEPLSLPELSGLEAVGAAADPDAEPAAAPAGPAPPLEEGIDTAMASMCAFSAFTPAPFASLW